ncbi:hypothetical protein [Methanococcus voltae]|uniref:Uncharacterized protein n=1 Tax=Methanococcus voltae (strain ATCC BAA-1334 / A3) TaxID=456320 RepID=D7DSQ5_METV3|nr:hypothetical protein [Methanococcus voltae]MCS3901766.1 hypothetical protein [Methanococcus voltae]
MIIKEIEFKSTPENYEKEKSGIKNNTVREFIAGMGDEYKLDVLLGFMNGDYYDDKLKIKIINKETGESFKRYVTDVTAFKTSKNDWLYIISWK